MTLTLNHGRHRPSARDFASNEDVVDWAVKELKQWESLELNSTAADPTFRALEVLKSKFKSAPDFVLETDINSLRNWLRSTGIES